MLAIFKFRQNFAKIGNFAKTFKISPGLLKFCHFSNFGENFASLATLIRTPDLLLESQECNHYAKGRPWQSNFLKKLSEKGRKMENCKKEN